MKKLIATLCLLCAVHAFGEDFTVEDVRAYTDPKTGLTILQGRVHLPGPGFWTLGEGEVRTGGLSDVFLQPPPALIREEMGERGRNMERLNAQRMRQRDLGMLYAWIRQYADTHGGTGAPSLDELLRETRAASHGNVTAPRGLFLVPGVPVVNWNAPGVNWNAEEGRQIVVFETHPAESDGKHWVLYNNGRSERLPIDDALFARHEVTLHLPEPEPQNDTTRYTVFALRRTSSSETRVSLPITHREANAPARLVWSWSAAAPGDRELLVDWGRQRVLRWQVMDRGNGSSTLSYWIQLAAAQYGVEPADLQDGRRRGRRPDRQTDMFNMLGGRAAIRETLQLQALAAADAGTQAPTIPVASLPGVEVKSHPFEEMLGGQPGGRLALADVAPSDRLFAYFARPENLLQFLEGGSDFLFRGGSTVTGRSLGYDLTDRYLARLGMDKEWIRTFLRSGAVEEVAVLLPDLFLIEGTDVTVVARLKNPALAATALKLLGLSDLREVVAHPVGSGQAYWTQRGDLLLVSTHAPELARALERIEDASVESLGRSAEFRYMLTQLPVEEATHSYFYISDPFIRDLVGPAAKIGQLRRLQARTEMEAITAGALLYAADGHTGAPALDVLRAAGYAPPPALVKDAVLDPSGSCRSATFGGPGELRTLLARPVDRVTQQEADAYKQYLDSYNRFWRRFFDPIAIRINQPDEKTMEVATFILPLVDNSLYRGAREVMALADTETPLPLPALSPEPVSTLSIQLNPDAWADVLQDADMSGLLRRALGIQLSLLDELAPDVHLALADADPIISIGSTGFTALGGLAGAGSEMMAISAFVSMLTRPCALLIGLNDPDAFRDRLRALPTGPVQGDGLFDFGSAALYKVSGRDAWRFVFSVEDVVSMRFGIEVKDRYLVISNLPLTYDPSVVAEEPALHNAAALHLSPAACVKQLPALHASAAEQQLRAAMYGSASLYALLRAGAGDVPEAQALHRKLFGFAPLHPDGGEWIWQDGELRSSVFGTRWRQESPEHVEGDRAFGTLRGIDRVQAAMQFEQDGLRATCRWEMKGGGVSDE